MILGVSFDSPGANKKFAEKYSFTFPLLCDTDKKMGIAYGATEPGSRSSATRMGVIIDPQGKIAHYWPKVKAKDFPTQALEALG